MSVSVQLFLCCYQPQLDQQSIPGWGKAATMGISSLVSCMEGDGGAQAGSLWDLWLVLSSGRRECHVGVTQASSAIYIEQRHSDLASATRATAANVEAHVAFHSNFNHLSPQFHSTPTY